MDDAPESGLLADEAVQRFLREKEGEVRATTVRAYRGTLEAFAGAPAAPPKRREPRSGFLSAGMMLEHVTAHQCKAFFLRPDISRTSRTSYGRQLRAFFNWCVEANLLRHSPMKGVTVPKAPKKAPTFLTREQFKHLVETVDTYATVMESDAELSKMLEEAFGLEIEPSKHATIHEGELRWIVDAVTVACGTGLRSGEVRSMRWDWIDLTEGTITVRETADFRPKNGDDRVIYVSGDALKVLKRR